MQTSDPPPHTDLHPSRHLEIQYMTSSVQVEWRLYTATTLNPSAALPHTLWLWIARGGINIWRDWTYCPWIWNMCNLTEKGNSSMCSPEVATSFQAWWPQVSCCAVSVYTRSLPGGISYSQLEATAVNCEEDAHFTHSALCFITSCVQRTVGISGLSVINQYLLPHLLGPRVTACAPCWEAVRDDMPDHDWMSH